MSSRLHSGRQGDALPAAPPWDPRSAARRTTIGSVLLVGAVATGAALVPAIRSAGPALLVLAGVLGLPHGAVDHLALGWARGRTGAAPAPVVAAYAAAAVAVAAVAVTAPLPAVLVLLVLSAAHFAEGEVAYDRLRGGAGMLLPAAALGTAVVTLPLVLRPEPVRALLAALDPGLPGATAAVRTPLLLLNAALVIAGLVAALHAGQRRAAGELALVVAVALLGPPLVVFAAWFGCWHAPRHLVRLLAIEPCGDGPERVRRLARSAALPTAVAALGLGALAVVLGGLPSAVLVVLLALTVPHAVVVARMSGLSARGTSAGPAADDADRLTGVEHQQRCRLLQPCHRDGQRLL